MVGIMDELGFYISSSKPVRTNTSEVSDEEEQMAMRSLGDALVELERLGPLDRVEEHKRWIHQLKGVGKAIHSDKASEIDYNLSASGKRMAAQLSLIMRTKKAAAISEKAKW